MNVWWVKLLWLGPVPFHYGMTLMGAIGLKYLWTQVFGPGFYSLSGPFTVDVYLSISLFLLLMFFGLRFKTEVHVFGLPEL